MAKNKTRRAEVEVLADSAFKFTNKKLFSAARRKFKSNCTEFDGALIVLPIVKSEPRKPATEIRKVKHGTLTLSPSHQNITLSISFKRENDSPEAFEEVFHQLIDGYTVDLIKKEIDLCLG